MRGLSIPSFAALFLALAGPAPAEITLGLSGDDDALEDDLRAASRLVQMADTAGQPAQDVIAAARADYARLLAVLYAAGYFGPEVSIRLDGREAEGISPFDAPGRVRDAVITVTPGRPFRLGVAEIGPLSPRTGLPEGFASGEPAGTGILRQAAEAGIAEWRNEGHATARVADQRITARHAAAELDAEITLAPGPVATFGALHPEGHDRMRADAIGRIAGLPVGERFDPATLDRVAARLRESGAFTSVGLVEEPITPDASLPIRADLVEAPLRRLGFGAELSSSGGATLSAYWLHRNLFGGAERLRFDAEIGGIGAEDGGIDATASATYTIPAVPTPDTRLNFSVTVEHLDDNAYELDRIDLSAGLDHWFSERLTGSLSVDLGYADVTDRFSNRDVTMFSLPATLTWDNRDDDFDATEGAYLGAELAPFAILNDGGGARLTLDARGYLSFGETDATTLAARVQLGTVEGGDIALLPPDWLFFSGGADTVRGQSYQTLGAMQGGILTGGRSFVGASLELRQDLFGAFGAVAFADIGRVGADAFWQGGSDWHAGAGLGLRYDTPVGPIRLDVATPVAGTGSSGDLHLYIGIGQAF